MTDQPPISQPTVTTEPMQAVAPEAPKPEYLNPTPRSTIVTLEHPFALNGREYRQVTVRRLTGVEVKAFAEAMQITGREPPYPGLDLDAAAYDALDDDDLFEVDRVVRDFLPRRFEEVAKRLLEAGAPSQAK